jgi:D-alanyl-D-alanine carboxypeptidase
MHKTLNAAVTLTAITILALLAGAFGLAGCGSSRQGSSSASSPDRAGYTLGHFPAVPTRQLPAAMAAKLQAALYAATKDQRLPSVTTTVLVAGRGAWSGAAGTADGTHPVVARSKYGIGSISKTVIAAEIMRLAEQHKLRLSDLVSKHLPPGFHFNAKGVTIKDLLALTAGIPDPKAPQGTDPLKAHPLHHWTLEEVLSYVPAHRNKPGVHWFYGDSDYILLALVVRHTTGMGVAAALRRHILADPRLSSLVYQTDERPKRPLALPSINGKIRHDVLTIGGGYLPTAAEASAANGSGGMASDAPALALFGYELFGRHLLSERSLKAMTTWKTGDHDPFGLGVFNDTRSQTGTFDTYAVGYGGEVPGGYSSELVAFPKKGIVISALTNTTGGPGDTLDPTIQRMASIVGGIRTTPPAP